MTTPAPLAPQAVVPPGFLDALRADCPAVAEPDDTPADWWPIAMVWALDGRLPGRAVAVARPADAAEVAAVLRRCRDAGVPVTAAGGRSGVSGAAVPLHGGIVLDTTALTGIVSVDDESLTARVLPGTNGGELEEALRRDHGLTCGHWPQSIELASVGGWVACRGAGQLSTRYGKIEDMVVGLEVALADGSILRTGGAPRAAAGPDLTQLFVGSEGTLGVITEVSLRLHPRPPAERRGTWTFPSFDAGLDACRRILRRGATPAVIRLYDAIEGERNFGTGDAHPLLVLDEGDSVLIDAVMQVVEEECAGAEPCDEDLVGRWFEHRNDVSALHALTARGYVVDTMEVAAPWSRLPGLYDATLTAMRAVEGMQVVSAHQSHAYGDGACLYFTFAGKPAPDERERFYVAAWDAGQRAALAAGGALSHHHGVGINRGRFMRDALGGGMDVLQAVKDALDPTGVLNPGKLGLRSPFGEVAWP